MNKTSRSPIFLTAFILVAAIVGGIYVYKNPQMLLSARQEASQVPQAAPTAVKPAGTVGTLSAAPVATASADPAGVVAAHTKFGFDMLRRLRQTEPNANVFISPSSIALALSMVYNGARGATQASMQQALDIGGASATTIDSESLGLINSLTKPDPDITLNIADSVWIRQGTAVVQDFIATLQGYYRAVAKTVDFADPNAPKAINGWVSASTNGKITSIVPDQLPKTATMYLINAVYFKGDWTKAFDPSLTQDRTFTNANGTSGPRPFMQRSGSMAYLETPSFQSVKLDYGKSARMSMYVFLPNGLDAFIGSLSKGQWDSWMSAYAPKEGDLYLPRFQSRYSASLKNALTALGMGTAFTDAADFSGIAQRIKIDDVLHKTFVDVNEQGTEAAAVTSVGMATAMAVMPQQSRFHMEVNHPFFVAIRDNQTGEIVFEGIVQN